MKYKLFLSLCSFSVIYASVPFVETNQLRVLTKTKRTFVSYRHGHDEGFVILDQGNFPGNDNKALFYENLKNKIKACSPDAICVQLLQKYIDGQARLCINVRSASLYYERDHILTFEEYKH